MKAIQVSRPGDASVLQLTDCQKPPCGEDEVLVQNKAAGINFVDVYYRSGLYKPEKYPYVPGKEGSGIVVEAGSKVKDLHKGDRVAFCAGGTGSYAEFTAIPAEQVVKIPENISFETAAAAMLQGLTAYYLSHLTYVLKAKQTALIHAGAGGVGLLLIQIAKMIKANVISTVSTDDKAALANKAGADKVIVYTRESFLEGVMDYTKGEGVNVVYDAVGKTTFDDSMKSLAVRGMLVSYGQASGPVAPVEMSRLAEKSIYLTRPSLVKYTRTHTELSTMAEALFKLIKDKNLQILIGHRYPLADAAKAQQDLEGRKTVGKSILVVEN